MRNVNRHLSRKILALVLLSFFASCKGGLTVSTPASKTKAATPENSAGSPTSKTVTLSNGAGLTYNAADFTLDADGLKLKTLGLSDSSYTSDGFSSGSLSGTVWDSTIGGLTITNGSTPKFPDNKSSTGWLDASTMSFLAHFDETTVPATGLGTVADSANGTSSTYTAGANPADRATSGKLGNGLNFINGTDYVNFGAVADYSLANPFSISFWIKPANPATFRDIFWKRAAGPTLKGFRMYLNNNDQPEFYFVDDNSLARTCRFWAQNTFLHSNVWHHVLITYDGSGSTTGMNLYANGVLETAPVVQNFLVADINGGGNLYIGDSGTNSAMGAIDEFGIFGRAFTAAEARLIYDHQKFAYSGYFDSRVGDARTSTTWTNFSWTPYAPYSVELPANAQSESIYTSGNIDMTGNIFNASLDGSSLATTQNNSGKGTATPTTSGAGPTFNRPGIIGDGVAFRDTAGQDLSYAHHVDFNTTSEITASIWVYQAYMPTHTGTYISKGNQFWLGYSATTLNMQYCIHTTNTACTITDTGVPIPTNTWTHLVFRYSKNLGTLQLFKNGVSVYSFADNSDMITNATAVTLGSDGTYHIEATLDSAAIFNRALTDAEIVSLYKRGALKISFQTRSCPDINCSGIPFVGSGATNSTFFNASALSSISLPSFSLTGIVNANRYFQYRSMFETLNSISELPYLKSVTVLPPRYDSTSPSAVISTSLTFKSLDGFTTTESGSGTLTYALSLDGGTTQYYWDGSAWKKSDKTVAQSNSAAVVNTNISSFPSQIGLGTLSIVAFFTSSGTGSPVLSSVKVTGTN